VSFFDRFREPWSLDGLRRPWIGTSLYEFLRSHIEAATGCLAPDGERLPDDQDGGDEIRWAPGALDGVSTHHMGAGEETLRVKQLVKALQDVVTRASDDGLRQVFALVTREAVLGVIDEVLEQVRKNPRLRAERVHALGLLLASEAPARDAVKFGMALLGTIQGADDSELLTTLGLHEEFTLFAADIAGATGHRFDSRSLCRRRADPPPSLDRVSVVGLAAEAHSRGRTGVSGDHSMRHRRSPTPARELRRRTRLNSTAYGMVNRPPYCWQVGSAASVGQARFARRHAAILRVTADERREVGVELGRAVDEFPGAGFVRRVVRRREVARVHGVVGLELERVVAVDPGAVLRADHDPCEVRAALRRALVAGGEHRHGNEEEEERPHHRRRL
jgi:hypothetical protein